MMKKFIDIIVTNIIQPFLKLQNTMKTSTESTPKKFGTNYKVATSWLHNSLILCNQIEQLDESVLDNMRFEVWDEEGNYTEIYQWYLTDCSLSDVEWLEEHFGLTFTYSDLLDLYILCVTHYGTSWDYVYCETDIENAKRELGEEL